MARSDNTDRNALARGLRTQAKRLRYLAKDVGDEGEVKQMSRQLDAQAAALDGQGDDADESYESEGDEDGLTCD